MNAMDGATCANCDALAAERGKWFDCYMGAVRLAERSGQERDDALARLAAAEAALRGAQGVIHEGLHGGRATVPEHQERCEKPACRRIRAALAGSREQAGNQARSAVSDSQGVERE